MTARIANEEPHVTQVGGGTWSPLGNRLFALLLAVHLFAQLGLFMNGLGAAWVLTDITDSPAVISALAIAVALPTFLLALFTGALADVVSRKKIIIFSQSGSMIVAGVFAVLSASDNHTTQSILGLTAALGVFTAIAAPAWIAIIPGLVPRDELAGAMTLSSAGISAAMAIGPAIGGFIIAAAGPTLVFVLNVAILAAGLLALRTWKPEPRTGLPAEHLTAAVLGGLRYIRHDRPLKVVIAKIIPFALTGVALMSLLPAVARFRLDAGPAIFGLLSAAGGIGAVLGLLTLPRVRRIANPDTIVLVAMVLEVGVFVTLAASTNLAIAFTSLVVAGAATLALVSTVMTMLQIVLPAWIRGRGVAIYLLALQGSFAVGAFFWGAVAQRAGLETTLFVAAGAMGVGAVISSFFHLRDYIGSETDVGDLAWEPVTATSVYDDDGPILVTARWQIDDAARQPFMAAMQAVGLSLKRQGALNWHLSEDVSNPGAMLESFTVATWSEYRHLPGRATVADEQVEQSLLDAVGTQPADLVAYRVLDLRDSHANKE
jgi:MFS family permease